VPLRPLATTLTATATVLTAGGLLLAAPALAGGAHIASSRSLVAYAPPDGVAGIPAGATARVHSASTPSGRSVVTLTVTGMLPGKTYGAHAHVSPCGMTGADAGPHWQRVAGPATSPEFANPRNEIWLDVTTDAAGDGTAKATLDFAFSGAHRPRSVIIHAQPTATGPTDSGVAGPRLGCLTVDF
jgi:superoxide dismutase, Cu-Zn family